MRSIYDIIHFRNHYMYVLPNKEEIIYLKEHEDEIIKDADLSYRYAKYVLKDKFALGEEIISSNAHASFAYSLDVIKGPWKKGEAAIATCKWCSFSYAQKILRGRFVLGEDIIMSSEFKDVYISMIK